MLCHATSAWWRQAPFDGGEPRRSPCGVPASWMVQETCKLHFPLFILPIFTFSTRCDRSGQRCCRYSQMFGPPFSFFPRRKEAVYLLLLNTRWTPPVFEEGLSIFSSCCCVATMNWRICGHQQIMCLIEVNYLFLLLGWLTLSFWLLSFDNWKIARKTLTIAGIPPYSSSRTASPFNLHKSTYLDLLKVLCDCRHQVDAALQGNALQGNLLTSEIPSPIMLGLIYCLLQTAGWGYSSPLLSMTQMRRAWAHQVIWPQRGPTW